jgi:hypothetical protein
MRQTISICDSCGARISKKARTKVSVVATIPDKRVIAEDDATETVEVDLCCACAAPQLQACLKVWSFEQQERWADSVKVHKYTDAEY